MVTNRDWVKYIDTSKLSLYPIQFANCDRLQNNTAVYIFDEVGCGKTISSGLMAIDYLYNHQNNPQTDRVLVITTNTLYKSGQFENEWRTKLPFDVLGLSDRFEIRNNHYSHFQTEESFGLVIIDEAHLFLNTETQLHKNLVSNIKAKKVVFLTATPIKEWSSNIKVYTNIAQALTSSTDGAQLPSVTLDTWNTKETLICSTFDVDRPVTRYFKDTVMAINERGYKKRKARRLLSKLWTYAQPSDKDSELLRNINIALERNSSNRFVIFVRYVTREAKRLEKFFMQNFFSDHSCNNHSDRTIAVVTGDNASDIHKYSSTSNLPTILILTYQVSEQGVNLPGFNYVINYHIPSYPAALEQRFGRIDRMGRDGSVHDEITMCFLVSCETNDVNTFNFYTAVFTYLHNLIPHLPSKNTVLSKDIIDLYEQSRNLLQQHIGTLQAAINDYDKLCAVTNYLNNPSEETADKCDDYILSILDGDDFSIPADVITTDQLKRELKRIVSSYVSMNKPDIPACQYKSILNHVADKIFCLPNRENFFDVSNITTVDAVNECAQFISNSPQFKEYEAQFQKEVQLLLLIERYIPEINLYFEDAFIQNDFDKIFPPIPTDPANINRVIATLGHGENGCVPTEQDSKLLLDNWEAVIANTPFFQMCAQFKRVLHTTAEHMRYSFEPFSYAIRCVRDSTADISLTQKFRAKCLPKNTDATNLIYFYENTNGVTEASNWLKLAYYYTRRECKLAPPHYMRTDRTLDYALSWLCDIYKHYEEILVAVCTIKKITSPHDLVTLSATKRKDIYERLCNLVKDLKLSESISDKYSLRSAFNHLCRAKDFRTYTHPKLRIKYWKETYYNADYWTCAILCDLVHLGSLRSESCPSCTISKRFGVSGDAYNISALTWTDSKYRDVIKEAIYQKPT